MIGYSVYKAMASSIALVSLMGGCWVAEKYSPDSERCSGFSDAEIVSYVDTVLSSKSREMALWRDRLVPGLKVLAIERGESRSVAATITYGTDVEAKFVAIVYSDCEIGWRPAAHGTLGS